MKYKIWINYEEQWDENDIPDPDAIIDGFSPGHAAEKYAEKHAPFGDDGIALIVQDPDGAYHEIEVALRWKVDVYKLTTLKELCSP